MSEAVSVDAGHSPSSQDTAELLDRLSAFNRKQVPDLQRSTDAIPCFVSAKTEDGTLVGAISGRCLWNTLHIDLFWIEDDMRGQGLGQRLLSACERLAIGRGCVNAYLETFSWQAKPFYENEGYRLLGTIEDMPIGHATHMLTKRLSPGSS
ncbi:GNAT family N-acetyltransferase [uncultured Algimonas sp.]|uniref:GNAT family N-acetyltransferase n=1 Tax=uncultured Algimonas sp. TaxID=1547920 RepID=UPI00260204C9|nr:GNAT family N-acetyltransferase [uncultured Algimonas sp.]